MIQQIIKQRYFLLNSRFVSLFLYSNKVAAADESPPVLALYRISRSETELILHSSHFKLACLIFELLFLDR
jgi:hypothetical protein